MDDESGRVANSKSFSYLPILPLSFFVGTKPGLQSNAAIVGESMIYFFNLFRSFILFRSLHYEGVLSIAYTDITLIFTANEHSANEKKDMSRISSPSWPTLRPLRKKLLPKTSDFGETSSGCRPRMRFSGLRQP